MIVVTSGCGRFWRHWCPGQQAGVGKAGHPAWWPAASRPGVHGGRGDPQACGQALSLGEGVPCPEQRRGRSCAQAWARGLWRTLPSADPRWGPECRGAPAAPGGVARAGPRVGLCAEPSGARVPGVTPTGQRRGLDLLCQLREEGNGRRVPSRGRGPLLGRPRGQVPPGRAPGPRLQGHCPAPPASARRAGPSKPRAVWGAAWTPVTARVPAAAQGRRGGL